MATLRIVLLLVALAARAGPAAGESLGSGMRKNPIRKVVTMLQDMQKSVEEEGEKQEDLFDKFMCYCSNGEGALEASISQGKAEIESLGGTIDRGTAEKSQLDQDIVTHKADREDAEKVIKESTAMREKEAAEFAATSADMKSNLQAMDGALAALKKGLSAALLQTGVGSVLRSIVKTSPLVREGEREMMESFLETGDSEGGGSDQIIGIVEQMKETYEGDLKEATQSEAESKSGFESLMTSKTAEIAAAGKAIETKTARSGQVAVETVQAKADLAGTEKAVAEDIEFKANLAKTCATKQKEYDELRKVQAEEIEAISDTIKLLNSDDALELFKKTLPSASAFIQTGMGTRSQQRRASLLIRTAMSADTAHSVERHLMLATLRSGVHGFEKMIAMLDGMVSVLAEEQANDDKKKAWCEAELDKAHDELKAVKADVNDLSVQIDEAKDSIATVSAEIEELKAGLVDLDKDVAEATTQRKKEHEDFLSTVSGNSAAVELLGMAKNRMNKFYNPSLYKEPPKKEEEDFFAQVSVRRVDLGEAPEAFMQYKKAEGSSSILAMMDEMIKETEMDTADVKHDEEEAQKDYEEMMNDAATKRTDDSKLIVTKEGEKAEKTSTLEDLKESHRTNSNEIDILETKIDETEHTCDPVFASYDATKEARIKETEGIKSAKGVLQGMKI